MKVKKYIVPCLAGFFSLVFPVGGQNFMPNTEIGGSVGLSYYLGDINPRQQFYVPGISFGLIGKHNFTQHHCLRVAAFYGQLAGDDLDFKNEFQQKRAHNFETELLDCSIGYEFNFMPYIINRRQVVHTTYLFGGMGYSLVLSSTTDMAENHFTVPFGAGYKYRFKNGITVGCEWSFRKTFVDTIDGLLNPGLEETLVLSHNNDWYSFACLYIAVRIYQKGNSCHGIYEPKVYK